MGPRALSAPEYQEEMALGRKRVLARGRVGPLHSFIPLLGRRRGSQWTNWNPFHGVPWLGSEDKMEPLFLKTIWRAAYFHFGWLRVSHATQHTHTHTRAGKYIPPSEAHTRRYVHTIHRNSDAQMYTKESHHTHMHTRVHPARVHPPIAANPHPSSKAQHLHSTGARSVS